ncbi:MAG TPA: hypothetical protein VHT92_08270 [Candidatus Cybelea sp.]|jgi:hypothetical protein|nr:hypothetical protein [Candidatus Cybelea sp.]
MIRTYIARLFALALLAGCSGSGLAPTIPSGVAEPQAWDAPAVTAQNAYWTLFAGSQYPQIEIARVPLTKKSKVTNIGSTSKNDLIYTSGVTFHDSRLWILTFGKSGGTPSLVAVFDLPLKDRSKPHYKFVLGNSSGADALAFDPSGNLWISSASNHDIIEYKGPFTKSRTLKPAKTFDGGNFSSYAVAIDKKGAVYVSINNGTSSQSIAVEKPPYTGQPYFLTGLTSSGGLGFDSHGNLYASSNGSSSTPALVRYDADNLKSGAKPNIVDPAGLPASSYLSSLAFTAKGDLYIANCGNAGSAGIDVYPLGTKQFSSKLAPSVEYTNADITGAGCAWGIAVH